MATFKTIDTDAKCGAVTFNANEAKRGAVTFNANEAKRGAVTFNANEAISTAAFIAILILTNVWFFTQALGYAS
jgi:hypothetical protein